MSQKFKPNQRLRSKYDIDQVFSNRKRLSSKHLLAYYRCNNLTFARIGIISAKKNVRLAVNRNRIRRVLKDYFRVNQAVIPAIDIVFIIKKGTGEVENNELRTCIDKLLKKFPHTVKK